ncbi:putative ABC transport system ATP-binding protein [Krasilnikovia cinnamomea]|uniref:Putative ABC transport system ATP-binding protein n=1 Tax=Krasilnikovia cinnamomea TaxID=349313 RepID=A0A4Q7ZQ39_9ACTN|nr:ATP-binding cassette domain-containing protein [Krasilnikovia cinnamomea]RZU53210.1 putative ABC transport system ATP-binding protein [Krasilnikovia cinnamomea]
MTASTASDTTTGTVDPGAAGVRVRGLTKVFGTGDTAVRAVDGVDLDAAPGEVVLVMGPSGSGKTTLLLMLGALLRPTAGTVILNGVDVTTAADRQLPRLRARHIGFVFQDFNLLSALTVAENVELACNLAGTRGTAAHHRAADLLDRFDLSHRIRFKPHQLSGGEKQRVALARALANNPAIVLADEPTANLDSSHGLQVARLLRQLATTDQRAIIVVSHDERLRPFADRVLWLEDGHFRHLDQMPVDPVCGVPVPAGGPHLTHDGHDIWFCADGCRDQYLTNPDRYPLAPAPPTSGSR